jgi:hypothetical protein
MNERIDPRKNVATGLPVAGVLKFSVFRQWMLSDCIKKNFAVNMYFHFVYHLHFQELLLQVLWWGANKMLCYSLLVLTFSNTGSS